MYKVQFESRREIEAIESALNTYIEDHPDADNAKKVEELSGILESMHRSW